MEKDDATWLRVSYIAFGLIVAYIFSKFFGTLGAQTGWGDKYSSWYPEATMAVSLLAGVGLGFWLRGDEERHSYFLASIGEVRKVVWPNALDTRRMTIIVCVFVAVFGVIISLIDYICGSFIRLLFGS